jgi:hypothetical protein
MQEKKTKYSLRQTYWFRGGTENVPIVLGLVNMHYSVRTWSGSHIEVLLGKSWILLSKYFLEVYVVCGNFCYTFCLSRCSTYKNNMA